MNPIKKLSISLDLMTVKTLRKTALKIHWFLILMLFVNIIFVSFLPKIYLYIFIASIGMLVLLEPLLWKIEIVIERKKIKDNL